MTDTDSIAASPIARGDRRGAKAMERIWLDPGGWLRDYSGVLEALAVVVASLVAIHGINAWRREMVGRRRAEVAEAVLAGFYEARDHLIAARSPASHGGEGGTRQRQEGESADDTAYRNVVWAPAERLLQKTEFYSRLSASRYRFMALFGTEPARHFDTVALLRGRVIIASRLLIGNHVLGGRTLGRSQQEEEKFQQRLEKWQRDIWWRGDDATDEIVIEMNGCIDSMERFCRPIIFGRGMPWWRRWGAQIRERAKTWL